MIIEEESRGDVERYEDVDGVMLMSREDEEDRKDIEDPAECVEQRNLTWSICSVDTALQLSK